MSANHSDRQLAGQLAGLGVEPDGVLIVHASLRTVGAVDGGPGAVVRALRQALGPQGTLVVPSFTTENSDTSPSFRDRVRGLGEEERAAVRASMPPFDRASTPAPLMGALAETVRLSPGALRSGHPQTSFAALGPHAERIVADHSPDCHLGEESPLARLYELGAQVLLLGTGFDRCTAFHLGEYRVPSPPQRLYRCVVSGNGGREWWEYADVDLDDSDFAALGSGFERGASGGAVRKGRVGSAESRLLRIADAVDFAQRWLPEHRKARQGVVPGHG
ncbi:AAC(3) family N-acetyltransferase [Streptomyces lunaelactis]|uniref:aminoglycoside N(3)-acetyltransferase n=2 Tax=Streptomyces lunaelactis TaxID=1535768 RepID=UPI0015849D06|nr:AAC(3) family N-acetyltransferase [Streptomyces lunaelactis]NUK01764.1 AAC(3) family N-acetyltransferase [Streptomyces lunaelactis]NUK09531.1 AAC(3) family N-acetyltransferase [Streptomyces lunaelactis]NUK15000.1 AAC(3) family N-acetyltransferase [Streptomyces lunaelactis]NUK35207.1 AAC(3) family N-acetyltransferase [Streptomyces lunaelactis]NUK42266.1 AAC(3) family N-acetyltransferase [Streptomyces lunaelactis]